MRIDAVARGRSLLVLLVMVWGASWPAIKVGVSAMPPVWFACLRYFVATVCGFGVIAVRGELKRPRAMAALLYVGPIATAFAYWAAVEVGRFVRATTMSMVLLAVPGLGLLLSTIALHESLNLSLELGILLIGGGIWVVTSPLTPSRG